MSRVCLAREPAAVTFAVLGLPAPAASASPATTGAATGAATTG